MTTIFYKKIILIFLSALLSGCSAVPNDALPSTDTPSSTSATDISTETPGPASTTTRGPTATEKATPTSSPAPSPIPAVSNSYVVVGVKANDVLNIREGAGVAHPITGEISPHGINIDVIGKRENVDNSSWVPVRYQGKEGWVNIYYLAEQKGYPDSLLLRKSNQIVLALKGKNLSSLASFIHPEKCLRFSPYPTIQPQHQVFCAQEIKELSSDDTQRTWGRFDGTGKPIEMAFDQYYDEFIYDANFAHAEMVGFNVSVGTGNAINNIHDFYHDSYFIEYHFPGFDPQYGGMDWRSLRLVFERYNQDWLLVAIVHGEWTI